MSKLVFLIAYGFLLHLSVIMTMRSICRAVSVRSGRGREAAGVVLWGIAAAVLLAPVWFWTVVGLLGLNAK